MHLFAIGLLIVISGLLFANRYRDHVEDMNVRPFWKGFWSGLYVTVWMAGFGMMLSSLFLVLWRYLP